MSLFSKLTHQNSASGESCPPRSVSITRASDIDELMQAVRGYRIGLLQLDRGPFAAEIIHTQLGGVLLTAAYLGRAVAHYGEPPARMITFAVRASSTRALWRGQQFGLDELIMGGPGVELDMVSQPGYAVATASFPLNLVEETAERLGWKPPPCMATSLLVKLQHDQAEVLRITFGALFEEAVLKPLDQRAALWARCKQEELLQSLLQLTFDGSRAIESVGSSERSRVLKAAIASIKDRPDGVLSISDLCRITKASERTLLRAFTERFGVSPLDYMKAHRLNGARNDLAHEPSVKISDAANKWGFWHLGQFAKDYRNWFGELPSDTSHRHHKSVRT
jgi:AraC-like DNA-binding protein